MAGRPRVDDPFEVMRGWRVILESRHVVIAIGESDEVPFRSLRRRESEYPSGAVQWIREALRVTSRAEKRAAPSLQLATFDSRAENARPRDR